MKQADIEYLTELDRVTVLLHPLRLQIMELAIEETSGIQAARHLGLPRQMVNYHVSALERAGFLIRVGDVRRRNMVERRLRSSARSYLISPEILGRLSGARRRTPDPASPDALISLTARVQNDLGPSLGAPVTGPDQRPTFSLFSKLHFRDDPDDRSAFLRALGESIVAIIRRFSPPAGVADPSQKYGLMLGLYPLPQSSTPPPDGDQR
jgi:DNA-binding transcriptional ArsR family regulator